MRPIVKLIKALFCVVLHSVVPFFDPQCFPLVLHASRLLSRSQEAADSGGTGCICYRLHVPERPSVGREQVDQGDTEGGWSQEGSISSHACIVVCPAHSHCCKCCCTAVRSERCVLRLMLVRVAVPTNLY